MQVVLARAAAAGDLVRGVAADGVGILACGRVAIRVVAGRRAHLAAGRIARRGTTVSIGVLLGHIALRQAAGLADRIDRHAVIEGVVAAIAVTAAAAAILDRLAARVARRDRPRSTRWRVDVVEGLWLVALRCAGGRVNPSLRM